MNRLRQRKAPDSTVGPFRTAKFTPLQAVARGAAVKYRAPAYIRGRPVRRVDQLPGLPMPWKVQVFRGGVAFDDCVLLPFPFSDALQSWLLSQAMSWSNSSGSDPHRVILILHEIECGYRRFLEHTN